MVCLLSLELDSGRVINIITKKILFIFVRFCDGFCVKSSENKSEIIIDNVCFTVFVTVLHNWFLSHLCDGVICPQLMLVCVKQEV